MHVSSIFKFLYSYAALTLVFDNRLPMIASAEAMHLKFSAQMEMQNSPENDSDKNNDVWMPLTEKAFAKIDGRLLAQKFWYKKNYERLIF